MKNDSVAVTLWLVLFFCLFFFAENPFWLNAASNEGRSDQWKLSVFEAAGIDLRRQRAKVISSKQLDI